MITPSYGLTATERVLPRLALDWTTGLSQSGVDVTRAGVATFIGSNGLVQSATADTQRVDYKTGVAGLLVEESRTNLLPYSIPDAAVPTGYNVLLSTGTFSHTLENGFGVLSGFQQIVKHEQSVSGRSPLNLPLNLSANTTYTLSIYVDTANSAITSGGTIILQANAYSDATGTISATLADADANGRIAITFTTGSDTTGNIRFGVGVAANATGVLYMGGWQLEAGAFPTSYIPTEATAVTRNSDLPAMTGTNFSDWFNPVEGTFVFEGSLYALEIGKAHLSIVSDISNFMRIRNAPSAIIGSRFEVTVGGVSQLALTPRTINFSDFAEVFAYKQDNFATAVGRGDVLTDTSGTVPVVDSMLIGQTVAGVTQYSGHIRKILYYPQRLTNAEVQAFSR
jgi:hypothetical protein